MSGDPKQILLFFLEQDVDDVVRQKMKQFVARIADVKEWANGTPTFVDALQRPDDEAPIETVGGYIELHSARPPWTVPRELELKELEDVEVLVAALCQFSRENGLFFMFALDGDFAGCIDRGEIDEMLSVVLIGEWRRGLGLDA